jgi:hypothetical protein
MVCTVDDVRFEQARKNQVDALTEGDSPIYVISGEDLIPNRPGSDRERGILSMDKGIQKAALDTARRNPKACKEGIRVGPATERRVGLAPESFLSPAVRWIMIRESQIGIP